MISCLPWPQSRGFSTPVVNGRLPLPCRSSSMTILYFLDNGVAGCVLIPFILKAAFPPQKRTNCDVTWLPWPFFSFDQRKGGEERAQFVHGLCSSCSLIMSYPCLSLNDFFCQSVVLLSVPTTKPRPQRYRHSVWCYT